MAILKRGRGNSQSGSDRLARERRRRSLWRSLALRPIAFEELENRVLLSITPTISGTTVTFSDNTPGDQLTLAVNDGNLEYSTNGTTFSDEFDSATGTQTVLLSSLTSIEVDLVGGQETLSLEDSLTTALLTGSTVLTDTGVASDTLATPGSNEHTWTLNSPTSVTLDDNIQLAGIGNLKGGGSDSVFVFTQGAAGSTYNLNGGSGGTNALDYSAYTTGVTVDLSAGTATDTGGVANISVVDGGSGNNSFTAGVGNETFNGGTGGNTTFNFDPDNKEGNDTVIGSSGTDGGIDTLDFSAATVPVTVDLSSANTQSIDPAGNLELTLSAVDAIQNVIGGDSGNDSLTGNGLDNTITAGSGDDTLTGGTGDDTFVFENNFGNDDVVESAADTSGPGSNTLDFSAVSANLTTTINADNTFAVSDGSGTVNASNVANLIGGPGSNWLDYSNYASAVNVDLATGTATDFANVTGFENVRGSNFNDTITGDANANILIGGTGDDTFSGGGGADTITGGSGVNTLVETFDADMTLTNSSLTVTPYGSTTSTVETLSGIELADLTGGTDSNKIDASAFTGLTGLTPLSFLNNGNGVDTTHGSLQITLTTGSSVAVDLSKAVSVQDVLTAIDNASPSLTATLNTAQTGINLTDSSGGPGNLAVTSTSSLAADLGLNVAGVRGTLFGASVPAGNVTLSGGVTTPLALLNNRAGVQTTDLTENNLLGLESTTLVSTLNNGDGVTALNNGQPDFEVILTDGTVVDVTLSINASTTVQDVLNQISDAANGRLVVQLDQGTGDAITLQDTVNGASDIQVVALDNSPAANDLGILTTGDGPFLEGAVITSVSADIGVTLTDGTQVDIDLSGLQTIEDVIATIDASSPFLTATINAAGTGLDLTDTAGGTGKLTVTNRDGSTAGTDLGIVGTANGNVLYGTSIVGSGDLRLDNRLRNDTLIGSYGNDTYTDGGGNATIEGGGGNDTLVESGDANFTLTDTTLTVAPIGSGTSWVETLSGISHAMLTGGPSNETLDASAFTNGGVTLVGGGGNDLLRGGSGNDFLTGGGGQCTLDGGGGYNTDVETADARFVVTGTPASATLDMGQGTDQVVTVSMDPTVTGGTFTLTYDGEVTDPLDYNASAAEVQDALQALPNIGTDNVSVIQTEANGTWAVEFRASLGCESLPPLVAAGVDLTGGGVSAVVTTPGATVLNTLTNIQAVILTAGASNSDMDASGYSGNVTMYGGVGDDTLIGGSGTNYLDGGSGNNTIIAQSGGGDTLIGGTGGQNELIETRTTDVSFTLTNTTLTATGRGITGSQVDTISGFQFASLTSGAATGSSGVALNASAFTAISPATNLIFFNGGNGLRTTDGTDFNMTGLLALVPLYTLNDGTGVQSVAGGDFQITLSNGFAVDVSISGAETLQDVVNLIEAASPLLTVGLTPAGDALTLTDSAGGSGNISVTRLNNSPAAGELGILGTGQGNVLTGSPISDGAGNLRITLTNGSMVDVDLATLTTIQDVLDAIDAASPYLSATLDPTTSAIVITDTSGGPGQLSVADLNGGMAAEDLGIAGTAASPANVLTGTPIAISSVTLTGGSGNDTLTGCPGGDTFTGGGGNNILNGGGETATVVESGDFNFKLTNTLLTMTDPITGTVVGSDTLVGIDSAELTGGSNTTKFNALAFSLGPVTLTTTGGLATLEGGAGGETTYDLDVAGLTAPSSATDTAHQFTVYTSGGTNDVVIQGGPSNVTQSDFWWVNFAAVPPSDPLNYQVDSLGYGEAGNDTSTLTETSNIIVPDMNIKLQADYINIEGCTLSTSGPDPGSITLTGEHIMINQGATLNADATPGSTAQNGAITIQALDPHAIVTQFPLLGNIAVSLNETDITI
ncbi:MAG: beta strand repeat-containing protein, partial [Isosphaeraceae bacterium]